MQDPSNEVSPWGDSVAPIYVYRVDLPEGITDLVTIVPPEQATRQGGLIPEAIVGRLSHLLGKDDQITSENFARNTVFVDFLHHVIAHHAPNQPPLRAEAQQQGSGWIYIIDQRTPTPEGEVPPEDIIGAFEVVDGHVVPESYRGSPQHRVLSAHGFFQLGRELHWCLMRELAKRQPVE